MWLNINLTSVRIKQFKHKISTHINQIIMNESNINVTSVLILKALNLQTKVSSWWFLFSLYFWTIKELNLVILPHNLFKCEQCDHEKHLQNTHKHVGSRFKCNQCGQIEIQWCNLKSHKQCKCINFQCD